MKLRLIRWIASKLRTRVIQGACGKTRGPLLTRHYIVDSRLLGIYLHNLLRHDERDPHDHPWSFVSVILNGGYFEFSGLNSVLAGYSAGSILYRHATHIHRLVVVPDTWTLVIKWKTRREWGFWVRSTMRNDVFGFIPWRNYDYEAGCE